MKSGLSYFFIFLVSTMFLACEKGSDPDQAESSENKKVRILLDTEPQNINSKYWSSITEKGISEQIFQKLIDLDPYDYQPIPVLAESLPEIDLSGPFPRIIFQIRESATWHDNTPVTAEDVLFTVKFAFNPFLEQEMDASFYNFIRDVEIDQENEKKVVIILDHLIPDVAFSSGSLPLLPKDQYDPNDNLGKYSIENFKINKELIQEDSSLKKLSEKILEDIYSWEPYTLIGSGPYQLNERTEGIGFKLQRIENWWGKEFENENPWFLANPKEISYRILSEPVTKKLALENQEVDVYRFSTSFLQSIEGSESIEANYTLDKLVYFGFVYLGLNQRSDLLKSPDLRKALSFLINKTEFVEYIQEGYGRITNNPFFGLNNERLNEISNFPEFNIDSAIFYLEKSDWQMTPDSKIREKEIDGESKKLVLRFVYSANNKSSEETGLLFKDKAEKAGVDIQLVPLEFGTYIDQLINHDFDITRGGFGTLPRGFNFRALFHTSAIDDGRNSVGFGNEVSDKLLEQLDLETDPERTDILKVQLSNELFKSRTWIFLYNPEIPVVVSKKYKTYINSPVFQGIWPPSLN